MENDVRENKIVAEYELAAQRQVFVRQSRPIVYVAPPMLPTPILSVPAQEKKPFSSKVRNFIGELQQGIGNAQNIVRSNKQRMSQNIRDTGKATRRGLSNLRGAKRV